MKRDKTSKPTWAKFARKPGKASSKDLKKALEDLETEKSQMESRKGELENLTVELALDELASEPSSRDGQSLSEVRAERAEISERFSVMDKASGLLTDAIQKAAKREKETRLKEIKVEIEHLRKMREADYKEGLKRLASAMPFLTSAMAGNPGDPLGFFEHLNRIKPTQGFSFQAKYNEEFSKVKPKINASDRFYRLNLERRSLEKDLRVGAFKPTGPKKDVNVNIPPRSFVKMTDPSMQRVNYPKGQGLVAGTPEKAGEGKFAV